MTSLGQLSESLPEGRKTLIQLEHEKLVELKAEGDIAPVHNANMYGVYTEWTIKMEVEAFLIKRLAKSPIAAIKVTVPNRDAPVPGISSRQTAKIMKAAQCFFPEIDFTK